MPPLRAACQVCLGLDWAWHFEWVLPSTALQSCPKGRSLIPTPLYQWGLGMQSLSALRGGAVIALTLGRILGSSAGLRGEEWPSGQNLVQILSTCIYQFSTYGWLLWVKMRISVSGVSNSSSNSSSHGKLFTWLLRVVFLLLCPPPPIYLLQDT